MCIEYMCIIRYMAFHFLFFLEILITFVYKKNQIYEIINKSFHNDSRTIFTSFQRISWNWNNNLLLMYFNLQPLNRDNYVLNNNRILLKLQPKNKLQEHFTLGLEYFTCKFPCNDV